MVILVWVVWLAVSFQAIRGDSTSIAPDVVRNGTTPAVPVMHQRDKRSSEVEEMLEELDERKRLDPAAQLKFSSWGGKRTRDHERMRFSSWAGKRDGGNSKFDWVGKQTEIDDDAPTEKRTKFYSWGGKRAKFSSWGGKRDNYPDTEDKRSKFNSWGGKRSDNYEPADYQDYRSKKGDNWDDKQEDFGGWVERRAAKFNSWGGKRTTNDTVNEFLILKRSPRYPSGSSYKRKPIFSSWGGKRTARSPSPSLLFAIKDRSWSSLLRPIRRGQGFYAWGGKRSA